jgi:hypothetical protein
MHDQPPIQLDNYVNLSDYNKELEMAPPLPLR